MTIWMALFLGWCLERAQMAMCAHNYGSLYNGFGAIEETNNQTNRAPMAYRVFVPWLIHVIEYVSPKNVLRINWYQLIKIILNSLVIWVVAYTYDSKVALVMMVLLLLTFRFDYWDWAVELASIVAALSGNLYLAIPLAFLHGLSRETAILASFSYYLATFDLPGTFLVGAAGMIPLLAVRVIVGKRELYCTRWMVKENWNLVKEIPKYFPIWHIETLVSLVITLLVIIAVIQSKDYTWPIPIIIVLAGWIMAKSDESRVFTAALPWVAVFISGRI